MYSAEEELFHLDDGVSYGHAAAYGEFSDNLAGERRYEFDPHHLDFDGQYQNSTSLFEDATLLSPLGGAYWTPNVYEGTLPRLLWLWWMRWLKMVEEWRALRDGRNRGKFNAFKVKAPLKLFRTLIRYLRGYFKRTPLTDFSEHGLIENSKRKALSYNDFVDSFTEVLILMLGGEHPKRKYLPKKPPSPEIEWFMNLVEDLVACRIHFFEMLTAMAARVTAGGQEGSVPTPGQQQALTLLRIAWATLRNRLGANDANAHGGVNVGPTSPEQGHPPF